MQLNYSTLFASCQWLIASFHWGLIQLIVWIVKLNGSSNSFGPGVSNILRPHPIFPVAYRKAAGKTHLASPPWEDKQKCSFRMRKPIGSACHTQSSGLNPFAPRNGSAPTGGFQYFKCRDIIIIAQDCVVCYRLCAPAGRAADGSPYSRAGDFLLKSVSAHLRGGRTTFRKAKWKGPPIQFQMTRRA